MRGEAQRSKKSENPNLNEMEIIIYDVVSGFQRGKGGMGRKVESRIKFSLSVWVLS